MTREELIDELKNRIGFETDNEGYAMSESEREFYTDILKELEQEPCEDCISRAEAIDALEYNISIESGESLYAYKTVIKEILCKIYDVQKKNIKKLPSVQPKPKADVLDKIKEEVKKLDDANPLNFGYVDVVYREDVLEIINKYRQE